jgi:hypothetical protein
VGRLHKNSVAGNGFTYIVTSDNMGKGTVAGTVQNGVHESQRVHVG